MKSVLKSALLLAFVAALVAALGSTGQAQAPAAKATLAGDLVKDWESQKDMLMKISDAMPEEKFGFKSTPEQRTYGEQIMHIATANVGLMKIVDAKATPPAITPQSAKTKAEILKALSDSYDFGIAALKTQTDATLQETVEGPSFLGPSTRARIAYRCLGHNMDIYGQLAVYLRLNGIVPPASRGSM
jgi:hypothetical protein